MIGIFDSGSGGLSVLRALRKYAPCADVVYFGDLHNAPYGNKSREELGALTVLGIQKLIDEGATEIISACNSVSVSIVLPMFDLLDLPRTSMIEMVGPTVTALRGLQGKVLVVATRATVASGVYQNSLRMVGVETESVAIPELVTLIEAGATENSLYQLVYYTLKPYAKNDISRILLGCTHYPLIAHIFEKVVSDLDMGVVLVDPAYAVARSAKQSFVTEEAGKTRLLVSARSDVFERFAATVEDSVPLLV